MKIQIRYFTGTGNSLKILDTFNAIFIESGHLTHISDININDSISPESDILVFCLPFHVFGIPRICQNYLKAIENFKSCSISNNVMGIRGKLVRDILYIISLNRDRRSCGFYAETDNSKRLGLQVAHGLSDFRKANKSEYSQHYNPSMIMKNFKE